MNAAGAKSGWMGPERGSGPAMRLLLWIALRLGYPVASCLLWPVALYYVAAHSKGRRASRAYLTRILGKPARLPDIARHLYAFCAITLDRIFLLTGRFDSRKIHIEGLDVLVSAIDGGKGCFLLGAHIGSFDVLRIIGRHSPVRLRMLMYRRYVGMATKLLERLDPDYMGSIIEIGRPDTMLRVAECFERGEVVGALADRAPYGEKCLTVPFLGQPARLPTGPLRVAATLGVPIVLFSALRRADGGYDVRFELLAERIELQGNRVEREDILRGWLGRYAAWMEALCRRDPFSWFNYFDFWQNAA
ncbi:acyltransferase [Kozakia baliensis]|uniref:LpxL/LpxP family acyltransferase n=1 Tax=Kozakia baliensis TaxID=153496 RepID=UPI00345C14EE